MAESCRMLSLTSVTLETLRSILVTVKLFSMIQNIIFSHIHLMGGWRDFHTLLGVHIEILSCDKTRQNNNHYTKMTHWTSWNNFLKKHFDGFDQWILTDNWNINDWGMDTYYSFMAAGSRRVFLVSHVYHAGKYQWFMVWCSWFLQNQLDEWIAEILPFLTTCSMSGMMKVEAGYVTAQCGRAVTYSPSGGCWV